MATYKTPLPVTGTFTPSGTQDVNVVSPNPLPVSESNVDKNFGTWSYYSGTAGTVVVGAGLRVLGIAAHSSAGGFLTINGGSAVVIPAGIAIMINPLANLTAPTIVFNSTDTYFIECVI